MQITLGGINNSSLGTNLQQILMSDEIQPGSDPSYELCKLIYSYHPLGAKMAESPVKLAMSQSREITIPNSPESIVKDAFEREWDALNIDKCIEQARILSRVYGIAAVIYGAAGKPTNEPIPMEELSGLQMYFNVLDPLNTAGSLVLNQNPNAPDFQKCSEIKVAGQPYHFSRSCVIMNESPMFIQYTNSAFGFVGRSVYQRALFPLKSFITSMIADDEIMKKCAVIVAKVKAPGSITDRISGAVMAIKRNFVKDATNGNVINISNDDSIETLNLQNVDKAVTTVRNNIIENIASSATMPPKLLLSDGYAGVLSNGTEDYKQTMQYINGERQVMRPLYEFFDNIIQHRAWSPALFARVQNQFPEQYGNMDYQTAFFQWKNEFTAIWPSLMMETDEEKSKLEKVKLDAIVQIYEKINQELDPENKAMLLDWVQLNVNSMKKMFSDPLEIDIETLKSYVPTMPETQIQGD